MTRPPTAKQILKDHLLEHHNTVAPVGWTWRQIALWHAERHHRYSTTHYHDGLNLGPDVRPPGWYTGRDAVPKS